jgi:hypothetical protein
MISKQSEKMSDLACELATSMQDSLDNKIDKNIIVNKNIESTIDNLTRSAELFDELKNYKAAEIITKIIEKLALNNGK